MLLTDSFQIKPCFTKYVLPFHPLSKFTEKQLWFLRHGKVDKCLCIHSVGFLSQFKVSCWLNLSQLRKMSAPQVLFPQSMQTCASEPLVSIRTEHKWVVLIEVSGSEALVCVFSESVSCASRWALQGTQPYPRRVGYFTSFRLQLELRSASMLHFVWLTDCTAVQSI